MDAETRAVMLRLVEALEEIAKATDPESPDENYRADDREGCLDWVAGRAANAAAEARNLLDAQPADHRNPPTARDLDKSISRTSGVATEAQPPKSACPHVADPYGCYRVRCQIGKVCVSPKTGFVLTPQPAGNDAWLVEAERLANALSNATVNTEGKAHAKLLAHLRDHPAKAQLEAARKDGERYLWLRDSSRVANDVDGHILICDGSGEDVLWGATADLVIDNAIAAFNGELGPLCDNCATHLPDGCSGHFRDDGDSCLLNQQDKSVAAISASKPAKDGV